MKKTFLILACFFLSPTLFSSQRLRTLTKRERDAYDRELASNTQKFYDDFAAYAGDIVKDKAIASKYINFELLNNCTPILTDDTKKDIFHIGWQIGFEDKKNIFFSQTQELFKACADLLMQAKKQIPLLKLLSYTNGILEGHAYKEAAQSKTINLLMTDDAETCFQETLIDFIRDQKSISISKFKQEIFFDRRAGEAEASIKINLSEIANIAALFTGHHATNPENLERNLQPAQRAARALSLIETKIKKTSPRGEKESLKCIATGTPSVTASPQAEDLWVASEEAADGYFEELTAPTAKASQAWNLSTPQTKTAPATTDAQGKKTSDSSLKIDPSTQDATTESTAPKDVFPRAPSPQDLPVPDPASFAPATAASASAETLTQPTEPDENPTPLASTKKKKKKKKKRGSPATQALSENPAAPTQAIATTIAATDPSITRPGSLTLTEPPRDPLGPTTEDTRTIERTNDIFRLQPPSPQDLPKPDPFTFLFKDFDSTRPWGAGKDAAEKIAPEQTETIFAEILRSKRNLESETLDEETKENYRKFLDGFELGLAKAHTATLPKTNDTKTPSKKAPSGKETVHQEAAKGFVTSAKPEHAKPLVAIISAEKAKTSCTPQTAEKKPSLPQDKRFEIQNAKKHFLDRYLIYLEELLKNAENFAFDHVKLAQKLINKHSEISDTKNHFDFKKRLESLARSFSNGIRTAHYETTESSDIEKTAKRIARTKNFMQSFKTFINHVDCIEPLQGFNTLFYHHGYMYVKTGGILPSAPPAKPTRNYVTKKTIVENPFRVLVVKAENGELLPPEDKPTKYQKPLLPEATAHSTQTTSPRKFSEDKDHEIARIYESIALGIPAAAPTTAAAPQPTADDTPKESESERAGAGLSDKTGGPWTPSNPDLAAMSNLFASRMKTIVDRIKVAIAKKGNPTTLIKEPPSAGTLPTVSTLEAAGTAGAGSSDKPGSLIHTEKKLLQGLK